ncbi:hypothetical protein V495_08628 [Pseudogymnoascus sp. VKM F-4514 (FW-929)]|nr:hypothetical protein V495_08628 [Pseudogymnoascus sp. VKM F-4514 (FW-929)]KFY53663.1 hypothetical protein V497_08356 [Pseudogymnoascus sp. VKM F-4516 (FW-969)]
MLAGAAHKRAVAKVDVLAHRRWLVGAIHIHRAPGQALRLDREVIQIRLHAAEAQARVPDPAVDEVHNLLESGRVPAVLLGLVAAADKEVAVHQLVEEGREEQVPIVPP